MINYRNTSLAWIVISLAFFLSGFDQNWVFAYIFFTLVYISLLVIGSVKIRLNFYLNSMNHGNRENPEAAITFDDGPHPETTPEIMDILKKYGIKAAFFCIGQKAEKAPSLIRSIMEQGHIIGNHSWTHSFWFDLFPPRKMIHELRRCDELIHQLTGRKPVLFRPPYGVTNPFLSSALKKTRHISVSWSLRSLDTTLPSDKVIARLERKLKNGDIVLFHDGKIEPRTLEKFILFALAKGKRFAGLDELLKISPYEN